MPGIPFEPQAHGQRTCGAAALNMVYRSFGIVTDQDAIWAVVAGTDRFGGKLCHTYRMTFDALARGAQAIAFRAREPVEATKVALSAGCAVIMNHRLSDQSPKGHYTVALDVDDAFIELHDPEVGPMQKRPVSVMRALWTRLPDPCEITGNFLLALTQAPAPHQCRLCNQSIPAFAACPGCKKTFPLQPAVALGCMSATCKARMWADILCPFCNATFA